MNEDHQENHKPTVFVEDSGTESPKKIPAKKLRRTLLIVLAIVVLGGGAAFLASKRGLTEALLSQALDAWIADQEAAAQADGTEIDIAYDSLMLEGNFGNQSATIANPTLKIAATGLTIAQSADQLTQFRTERLILYPQDIKLSNVRIELPDVVEITNGSVQNPTFKVKANTPLMLRIEREKEDDKRYVRMTHYVPNAWNVQYLVEQEDQSEEDSAPLLVPSYKQYNITLDEGGKYTSRMLESKDLGEGELALSGITLADESGAPVMGVASLKSTWSGAINDTGVMVQSFKLDIENAEAGAALPELSAYTPVNVRVHAGLSAHGDEQAQTMALTMQDVRASFADSSVRITGGFEVGGAEALPLGKALIEITNLAGTLEKLQRDGVITAQGTALVDEVAKAILDEGYALGETVSFTISREAEGGFMIGKAPFELLLGTVLKSAMEGVTIRAPQVAPATNNKAKSE